MTQRAITVQHNMQKYFQCHKLQDVALTIVYSACFDFDVIDIVAITFPKHTRFSTSLPEMYKNATYLYDNSLSFTFLSTIFGGLTLVVDHF